MVAISSYSMKENIIFYIFLLCSSFKMSLSYYLNNKILNINKNDNLYITFPVLFILNGIFLLLLFFITDEYEEMSLLNVFLTFFINILFFGGFLLIKTLVFDKDNIKTFFNYYMWVILINSIPIELGIFFIIYNFIFY